MRISTHSDYALRLLMHVAARHPELVTIQDVADGYGISKNHLMKIAHQLALGGYLETQRGRTGGLRLARNPGDINLGAVLRLGEGGTPLVECFDRATNACVITPACKLKFLLKDAEDAFYGVLDRYTLQDLQVRPAEFLALLKPRTPG
jgi:Rrf2 family nitric oxide-sensitive transcriptional repressor